jgi:N-acetyl-anhydromuramyl-L-alanine amidase AmpD
MNIQQFNFDDNQYHKETTVKNQVYLHHTAGNSSALNVYQDWARSKERIGTCVAISGKGKFSIDGQIIQGFSSNFWAYHLGVKSSVFKSLKIPYKNLDKFSIGIEICNWGQLTKKGDKFYNYVKREVPANEVCELSVPFKGYKYFHDYTDAQIASVKELLLLWNKTRGIPLDYKEDIWNITPRAFKGESGIFTHNSVRKDKVDVYPNPKLIEMLKSLKP